MKAADLIRRGVPYTEIADALKAQGTASLPEENRQNAEEIDIMLRYEG